jgi:hypothetical protein
MSIFHTMFSGWQRFPTRVAVGNRRHTLIEDMSDAYRAELALAALCLQHARRMCYPQFHAELLRIAAEVQAHLPWLQEQILALGGTIPSLPSTLVLERNSWECFRRDVEEARCACVR